MKQYSYITDIAPDRITLQNMDKKLSESFRQYVQIWREVATQVQPPLLEKETTMLFIDTLKALFIIHMLGNATKSFTNIVMSGEMIENAIRSGKIEVGENTRMSAPKKRENEVGNVSSGYAKPTTVNQSRAIVTGQQASPRREPNTRQNTEKFQFTPIPVTYRELYKSLFDVHVAAPFDLELLQPPYPKWYDTNAQCEYHAGITGYSIENCTSFKRCVERLIKAGVVKFDDSPGTGNPLPSHTDKGVNAIIENMGRKVKLNIAEVRTPLKLVWKEMHKRGLAPQGLGDKIQDTRNYCEFHNEKDHEIQNCIEFRALVQGLMDNKELEFLESVEEGDVCSLEGESSEEGCRASRPVIIISKPRISEVEARVTPRVIIQKPTVSPYKDSHRVPWNYNCSIAVSEKESSISTPNTEAEPAKGKPVMLKQEVERAEPLVNEPVIENEAKEFLKFLRHSEYSIVEQLHQQPDRILVLALLLNSEVHRNALTKVLNETYVADDISVNKLDRLVGNISADNFISFSDNEISPGGRGSTKAPHVTARCKGYTLARVLVDNGSALNVLHWATLNHLPIDSSHMKTCQNVARAFDGTERKVMGRIEVPLQIGPNTYEVDFLVMDIKPSYNCLLARPWIHSAGAVPSSLHQKLKMVTEERLITINAEEDIIASVTSDATYVENDNEAVECSFRLLEFVNKMFIAEGSRIPIPKISGATKMSLQLIVEKGALPGRGLGRYLRGQVRVPILHKVKEGMAEDAIGIWSINATFEEEAIERNLSGICPYEPGSVLDNWTEEEIPAPDVNVMSNADASPESPLERDMCFEGFQNFKEDEECGLSPDLLKIVEREEEQILPHKETTEIVALEEGKEVKIGTCVNEKTRQNLIKLLQEFKDVFAWSYQDMPGLITDIAVHRVPTKKECKLVQQKLRRMRLKKQFNAGFLQVVNYSEWVANVIPIPKKDGKVRMCVDYKDLNKASPKDNFPLPHIDTLVDNKAGYSLFSFMDGFSEYNQIKMYPKDMEITTFITLWGTFCYKVMPFGLKNAEATYQRAMLNPSKCTFGTRSGKLLGFVVSEKGIEVDPDKVKAIQKLPQPRTQKEV
ncbi:uncharacterized protein [Gossypium hirsutum]|uniref:Reverse transcriptase domain-containing protein n=1 Tax=Gossypium hirsutum TaxID=3635 RepID=A0A1U8PQT0_GOSHI|nr:uncharacterized protein LOC107960973 [Gossypium hirsutum]